ncbi:MAG: GNAT family N-acetyltransferase, partial [Streptosporangiaceae bacterium]
MTGTTGLVLRSATGADMTDVHAVVTRSGLRSGRDPAALEFYRTSPGGQLIMACQGDRVTGVSCAVSFGRTGWIGNVAVDPDARGRGLGTAVSAAALDALRAAGAATVLLTATDLGRPIYERLGFGYDGMHYGIWRREPPPGPHPGHPEPHSGHPEPHSVPDVTGGVRAGTHQDVRAQDLQATGEDRGAFLGRLGGRVRVPA